MSDKLRSTLAHELKTPLAVITGYADLLRIREDEGMRREASERILEAAERLSHGIDELVERLAAAEEPAAALPRAARPRRILLVDDDAALRSLLTATFPSEHFELVEAGDGEQALALAETEELDAVVLDWDLPKVTGAEVLASLKRRDPGLAVIVLTVDAHAEAGAADAFLTKPFSPVQLLDQVDQLLSY